ncbi:IS5/IS1182 family transposase, partial [Bacillus altitudinis]|nr:IS5/IS1182 family transposase [Bacillus altitudinis]
MLSKREEERRNQLEVVALDELVPEDHLVRKIDQAIDYYFVYYIVKDHYSSDNG